MFKMIMRKSRQSSSYIPSQTGNSPKIYCSSELKYLPKISYALHWEFPGTWIWQHNHKITLKLYPYKLSFLFQAFRNTFPKEKPLINYHQSSKDQKKIGILTKKIQRDFTTP